MQRFDCLARDCPLFGSHLLEASAGTGKTFSIEHIFVRLILESIKMEQILAVTFTRAATRELKARIRANLEKTVTLIQSERAEWDYLHPYLGSAEAIRKLTDALSGFDRCQIFTIHGFCHRMLKEFAFEARLGFFSSSEEKKKNPENLRLAAFDFLESGIDEALLCPEQAALLFKQFESVEEIVDRLLRLDKPEKILPFSQLFSKCKAALHPWSLKEAELLEDFRSLEKGYKAAVKGSFEIQIKALADMGYFGAILKEKGSLFDFLDPSNRKVRAQGHGPLHYPGFFDWARVHIAHLVKQPVFPVLQAAWNPIAEKILAQEEHLDPDEILARMKKAVEKSPFAQAVRQKYAAAIIDEFQDTDVVQWDIFQRLFLEEPLRALYLVGDPKQSIYRFRKADVYTYLKARDLLGEERLYQLDTNFRSSKSLIGALNALFCRDWFFLPKTGRTLRYHPIQAGAKIDSSFSDEKGAIHFFVAEGDTNGLFDDTFLPFTASEIERLHLRRCALLVKDRYQAERALAFLKRRNIPAVAKSRVALGQTAAFRSIRELFEAIAAPRDQSAVKIALAGPLVRSEFPFSEYRAFLEEKGLVPLACELQLDGDAMQIFELLFDWEKKEGFSFEGLKRFLHSLERLDPEEGGRRRMEVDEEAVQIMTLHISKGLEFDVVFALGLSSRTPEADEEMEAEKLRQLYVAMTRAKKRLYVPLALAKKEPDPGTHSPLELFSRCFEGSLLDQLVVLSKTESITIELLSTPFVLGSASLQVAGEESVRRPSRSYSPSFLSSFTTLAKTQETEVKWAESPPNLFTLQTMPRGPETGTAIHRIFETIFSGQSPIWRNLAAVDAIIAEQLRFSALEPWKEAIQTMVWQMIAMPLQAEGGFFVLEEIDRFQVEMEFVFSAPPHFVKGFVDLVFRHRGRVYFLDWKTNWLEDYGPASLQKAMTAHDYGLQASLYAEAVKRHFQTDFGGAYYVFVRGGTYFVWS